MPLLIKKLLPPNIKDAMMMVIFFGCIGYFSAWCIGMSIMHGSSAPEALSVSGDFLRGKPLKVPFWFDALVFAMATGGAALGIYLTTWINELDANLKNKHFIEKRAKTGKRIERDGKPTLTLYDFKKF